MSTDEEQQQLQELQDQVEVEVLGIHGNRAPSPSSAVVDLEQRRRLTANAQQEQGNDDDDNDNDEDEDVTRERQHAEMMAELEKQYEQARVDLQESGNAKRARNKVKSLMTSCRKLIPAPAKFPSQEAYVSALRLRMKRMYLSREWQQRNPMSHRMRLIVVRGIYHSGQRLIMGLGQSS